MIRLTNSLVGTVPWYIPLRLKRLPDGGAGCAGFNAIRSCHSAMKMTTAAIMLPSTKTGMTGATKARLVIGSVRIFMMDIFPRFSKSTISIIMAALAKEAKIEAVIYRATQGLAINLHSQQKDIG